MSNGQDAHWSRMTLRAHTKAWLHRHEDLDMASRTRNGPGEWNNPRDMENIPCVVERDAVCFCLTPALPERSDIREHDRYFPPPRHFTSLPPRMCGSRPPLVGVAPVLSFSTATNGASATHPNGASDSDAWARAFDASAQRDTRPPERSAPPERHGHHRLSTTDSVIFECAHVYHGGTRRWRAGVAVRPRRPGHDSALAHCAWEKTLAEGDASFAEREGGPRWGPQGYGLYTAAPAAIEDRWLSKQRYILFAPGLRAGGSGSASASAGVDVGGVGRKLDAAVSA
ncbi:hypothetical protein EV715DRAFT_254260 [Schizophyllum commune]